MLLPQMQLTGTYTALVTPFSNDEEIDMQALKALVSQQVEKGITGLVPCGTTGESPTLNHDEHRRVIARVVEWGKSANPDLKILAGTGSNSTKEAIELTRAAANDGADFALLVNPYYNKPTQEGLRQHFTAIADDSKIPIVLYNIPGRTAVTLSIETVIALSKHPNIIGIKEATGDLNFMAQVIVSTADDFSLMSGDDNLLLPVLSLGGNGIISVISNLYPEQTSQVTKLHQAGKLEEAKAMFFTLFPLMGAMFSETNPIPVKYAMSYKGLIENTLRLPLTRLSEVYCDQINTLIDEVDKKI